MNGFMCRDYSSAAPATDDDDVFAQSVISYSHVTHRSHVTEVTCQLPCDGLSEAAAPWVEKMRGGGRKVQFFDGQLTISD